MADDLSQLSEQINWPRFPELKEFEQMAEMTLAAGYHSSDELADTSSTQRQQLYKLLSGGRPGWDRLLRKAPDGGGGQKSTSVLGCQHLRSNRGSFRSERDG